MDIAIELAKPTDLPSILTLLDRVCLPKGGLKNHLATTLVARTPDQQIIGCAALELYGKTALLRSVAVQLVYRGKGLGQSLIQEVMALARQSGVAQVYLLTETASKYFPRFGFEPISRTDVPESVQHSVEFVMACPRSSLPMRACL